MGTVACDFFLESSHLADSKATCLALIVQVCLSSGFDFEHFRLQHEYGTVVIDGIHTGAAKP